MPLLTRHGVRGSLTSPDRPPLTASIRLELTARDRAEVDRLRALKGLPPQDWSKHAPPVEVVQEGGMMWAEAPGRPGCFASGETEDELREALAEAVQMVDRPQELREETSIE